MILNSNPKDYYVYGLLDPVDLSPFYIGKGNKRRMYDHVSLAKRGVKSNGNDKLFNKIKSILCKGLIPIYKVYLISKNQEECYSEEKRLISFYGLKTLCNLTAGGEGGDFVSKHPDIDGIKRKMSLARKGKKHTTAHKKKIAESIKNKWKDKDYHDNIVLKANGRKHTQETKDKIGVWSRNRTPEMISKHASKLRGRKQDSDHIKKRVLGRSGYKHSDETKLKISISKRRSK